MTSAQVDALWSAVEHRDRQFEDHWTFRIVHFDAVLAGKIEAVRAIRHHHLGIEGRRVHATHVGHVRRLGPRCLSVKQVSHPAENETPQFLDVNVRLAYRTRCEYEGSAHYRASPSM